jgi:spermidine/putrescine transport system substrate-binding protein
MNATHRHSPSAALLASWIVMLGMLVFGTVLGAPVGAAAKPPELVLLNWSEYMDPEVLQEFEREHGVRVREVYFDGDDDRDAMMLETGGRGFDLVLVNGALIETYKRRDWIEPIDASLVPNLRHIEPRWRSAYADAETHAVPLFWGTLGIVYRSDLVPQPITRWMDLLQPQEALRGRITMINSSRDLMGVVLKALGFSANSTDPEELAAAERLLLAQKPFVKDYFFVLLSKDSSVVKGDVLAAMVYNGDGLALMEHEEALRYLVPEEGSLLWVDYLSITSSSRNKALAHRFLNFIQEPERAARLARYLHYATPNRAALALLPQEELQDEAVYPPAEVLEKLEAATPLTPAAARLRNEIYNGVVE